LLIVRSKSDLILGGPKKDIGSITLLIVLMGIRLGFHSNSLGLDHFKLGLGYLKLGLGLIKSLYLFRCHLIGSI
jgi:hypothetical protein